MPATAETCGILSSVFLSSLPVLSPRMCESRTVHGKSHTIPVSQPTATANSTWTRPGWGDRRIVKLRSPDTLHWDHLELALQPEVSDPPGAQIYGLPMSPYGEGFVGFLWMAQFSNAERLERFNQLWG